MNEALETAGLRAASDQAAAEAAPHALPDEAAAAAANAPQRGDRPEERAAVRRFFAFAAQFAALRSKPLATLADCRGHLFLDEIDGTLPGVRLGGAGADIVLEVRRTAPPPCPIPPEAVKPMLGAGWDDPSQPLKKKRRRSSSAAGQKPSAPEEGAEDAAAEAWQAFAERRDAWAEGARRTAAAFDLFERLHSWKSRLEKAGSAEACFLANGFCVGSGPGFPLLFKRAQIRFDEAGERIAVVLCTAEPMAFRSDALAALERPADADGAPTQSARTRKAAAEKSRTDAADAEPYSREAAAAFADAVAAAEPDLLSREDAGAMLQRLAMALSPRCRYAEAGDRLGAGDDSPAGKERRAAAFAAEGGLIESFIAFRPVLLLAPEPSGAEAAIGRIIADIDRGGRIPVHLRRMICGYRPDEAADEAAAAAGRPNALRTASADLALEARLAAAGGEDPDLLLALPANREQLEAVRRMRGAPGVLVQGPPGTGKTWTIANLLGELLADGKRVLVTSEGEKALSVLKTMLPQAIKPLAVSFLAENGDDLKQSVSAVCERLARPDYSIAALDARIEEASAERLSALSQLSDARRRLFAARAAESAKFAYGGAERTLAGWAEWLKRTDAAKDAVPDPDAAMQDMRLSERELAALYEDNARLSPEDEAALENWLPDPAALPLPAALGKRLALAAELKREAAEPSVPGFSVEPEAGGRLLVRWREEDAEESRSISASASTLEALSRFPAEALAGSAEEEPQLVRAEIAGMDPEEKVRWAALLEAMEEAGRLARAGREEGAPAVKWPAEARIDPERLKRAAESAEKRGALPGLWARLSDQAAFDEYEALRCVTVNGRRPESKADFAVVAAEAARRAALAKLEARWNALMNADGTLPFSSFGAERPEREALRWAPALRKALDWWSAAGSRAEPYAEECGFNPAEIFATSFRDPDPVRRLKLRRAATNLLMPLKKALERRSALLALFAEKREALDALAPPAGPDGAPRTLAAPAAALLAALADEALPDEERLARYSAAFDAVMRLRRLAPIAAERRSLLEKLSAAAPRWAAALEARAPGFEGPAMPPAVLECLRRRDVERMMAAHAGDDADALQLDADAASKRYRKATEALAAAQAWRHLQRRLQRSPNLLQALQSWEALVKKSARPGPAQRERLAAAREAARICQRALPVWIMSTQKALSTLSASEKFDAVVFDEASQSDIRAAALLYLGEKCAVVGDDEQVSPMGVGLGRSRIAALQAEHLQGVRNRTLLDESTSVYDLAKWAWPSPCLLREHYRSVKEIIGFSSELCYDGKILPLRDGSDALAPHLALLRTSGERQGDRNEIEADAAAALAAACALDPACAGKTIGIISMVSGTIGSGQADLIERKLRTILPPREFEAHRIVCGAPAALQGDERDIVILSFVASAPAGKVLPTLGFGANDANKKRFNVAVSRARDQLWAVHSFDPDSQLAAGDLRKRLFDWIRDPEGAAAAAAEKRRARLAAEGQLYDEAPAGEPLSPLEAAAAEGLRRRGFQIEERHAVGIYSLSLVALDGTRRAAIECDSADEDVGTQPRSGSRPLSRFEERIAASLERQTVLERSGWRFVHLKESSFRRDPEAALDRLAQALEARGIFPSGAEAAKTAASAAATSPTADELQARILARAKTILAGLQKSAA